MRNNRVKFLGCNARAYNPSILEEEAGGLQQVHKQSGLYIKHQATQGYLGKILSQKHHHQMTES